jgi:hypothetical protein
MNNVPDCNIEKELIEKARSYSKELFYMASGSKKPIPSDPYMQRNYVEALKKLTGVTQQIRKFGKMAFRGDPGRRRAYRS